MSDPIARDLLRGSLDLMILSVLAEEPKYGYLIQKKLKDSSDDQVTLSAGTMYPLLHRLEDDGLIKSRWDSTSGRKRKYYQLTVKGRRRLESQAIEWSRYASCISNLLAAVVPPIPALPKTKPAT